MTGVVHQTARGNPKFRSESEIHQERKHRPICEVLKESDCESALVSGRQVAHRVRSILDLNGSERISFQSRPKRCSSRTITNGGVSLLIEKGAASALARKALSTVEVLMLLTAALRQIQLPPAEREGWWL